MKYADAWKNLKAQLEDDLDRAHEHNSMVLINYVGSVLALIDQLEEEYE